MEIKSRTPARKGHYQQMMIERERPRLHATPGKDGAVAAAPDIEPFNPAAVLKTLPNATTAAYWLRRSAREESNGNMEEAASFLEQGIRRHAEPSEELVSARTALAARVAAMEAAVAAAAAAAAAAHHQSYSTPPRATAKDGAVDGNGGLALVTTAPLAAASNINADSLASLAGACYASPSPTRLVGSVVVVTPVRTPRRHRAALECGETVLTPVRRSARKGVAASHLERGAVAAMLESTGFAYVPNEALVAHHRPGDDHEEEEQDLDRDAGADEDTGTCNVGGKRTNVPGEARDFTEREAREFLEMEALAAAEARFAAAEARAAADAGAKAADAGAKSAAGAATATSSNELAPQTLNAAPADPANNNYDDDEVDIRDGGANAGPNPEAAGTNAGGSGGAYAGAVGIQSAPPLTPSRTPSRMSRVVYASRSRESSGAADKGTRVSSSGSPAVSTAGTSFGGVKVTVSRSGLFSKFSGSADFSNAATQAQQLTPGSEFIQLEAEATAEAAAEAAQEVAARVAQSQALNMLMRQENMRSSGGSGCGSTGSPRRPPKSPSTKKSSGYARAAMMAAAQVGGGGSERYIAPAPAPAVLASVPALVFASPAGSTMISPSVLMPDLDTPTLMDEAATAAFASLVPSAVATGAVDKAEEVADRRSAPLDDDNNDAAIAAVFAFPPMAATLASGAHNSMIGVEDERDLESRSLSVSPTAAMAEALAANTPGSVNTRRRRPRRTPSPIAMAFDAAVDSPPPATSIPAPSADVATSTAVTITASIAEVDTSSVVVFDQATPAAVTKLSKEQQMSAFPVQIVGTAASTEEAVETEETRGALAKPLATAAVADDASWSPAPAAAAAPSSPAVAALAPTAAAVLSLSGVSTQGPSSSASSTSPLSVFARMMAKVIDDTAADIRAQGAAMGSADDAAAVRGGGGGDEVEAAAADTDAAEAGLLLRTTHVTRDRAEDPPMTARESEQSEAGGSVETEDHDADSKPALSPARSPTVQGGANAPYSLTPTRRSARKGASTSKLSGQASSATTVLTPCGGAGGANAATEEGEAVVSMSSPNTPVADDRVGGPGVVVAAARSVALRSGGRRGTTAALTPAARSAASLEGTSTAGAATTSARKPMSRVAAAAAAALAATEAATTVAAALNPSTPTAAAAEEESSTPRRSSRPATPSRKWKE